jgi:hypothetical protein
MPSRALRATANKQLSGHKFNGNSQKKSRRRQAA